MLKQKLARKWGHAIARGCATLLLDRLKDFAVAPSSVGGNSSPLHDSQGVDELATLDRYNHFHGHSGLCELELELIQTQMAQKPIYIYRGPIKKGVRRRFYGTLSVSYHIQSPLGGGSEKGVTRVI